MVLILSKLNYVQLGIFLIWYNVHWPGHSDFWFTIWRTWPRYLAYSILMIHACILGQLGCNRSFFFFLPKVVRHYQFSPFYHFWSWVGFVHSLSPIKIMNALTCILSFIFRRYLCQLFLLQWICSRWENWVEDLSFKMLWYA